MALGEVTKRIESGPPRYGVSWALSGSRSSTIEYQGEGEVAVVEGVVEEGEGELVEERLREEGRT